MPIPTWAVGQVLSASDVNTYFVPLVAIKPSDQSITSNVTPATDSALFVPMAATATYEIDCFIIYSGGTQGAADIKFLFTGPASSVNLYTAAYVNTAGNPVASIYLDGSASNQAGTNGAGNKRVITIKGTAVTAGTSGNLNFQWSQGSSSGTATIVAARSFLSLTRIS